MKKSKKIAGKKKTKKKSILASERRGRIRVPLSKPVKHSTYHVLGSPIYQESSAIDLSSSGISFQSTRDYAVGALVILEVEMVKEAVKLLVCVTRCRHDGDLDRFLIGAELVAVDPQERKQMQAHLARLVAQSKGSRKIK